MILMKLSQKFYNLISKRPAINGQKLKQQRLKIGPYQRFVKNLKMEDSRILLFSLELEFLLLLEFQTFVPLGPGYMTIFKPIISMNLKISSLWISSRRIQNHFTHSQRKSCPENFLRQSVIISLLCLKRKAF